jgi:hypothetical protein
MTPEERVAKLKAVFRQVRPLRWSAGGYENNKRAQCTVCLLQMMGVNLGYDDFQLKIIGVHSNELSKDLHANFKCCDRRDRRD